MVQFQSASGAREALYMFIVARNVHAQILFEESFIVISLPMTM